MAYLRLSVKGRCNMIAVIFEVWPKDGHREPYLNGRRP